MADMSAFFDEEGKFILPKQYFGVPDWLQSPMGPPAPASPALPAAPIAPTAAPAATPVEPQPTEEPNPSTFEEFFSLYGPQPPEKEEDKRPWIKNPQVLEALRGMSESLGNIRAPVAGEIMFGLKQKPFVAEGIRKQISDVEDELTPREANMLNDAIGKKGLFSAGMKSSRIKQFMPLIGRAIEDPLERIRAEIAAGNLAQRVKDTGIRERGLDIRETQGNQRLNLTEKGLGLREKGMMIKAGQDVYKVYADNPTVKHGMETIAQSDKALSALNEENAVADVIAAISTARSGGEKGALSEGDVNRILTRMGLSNKIEDLISRWGRGRLSESHRAEISSVLTAFKIQAKKSMSREALRAAERESMARTSPFYGESAPSIFMNVIHPFSKEDEGDIKFKITIDGKEFIGPMSGIERMMAEEPGKNIQILGVAD